MSAAKSVAIFIALALLAGLRIYGQATETHSFTSLNRSIPDGSVMGASDVRILTSTIRRISSVRIRLHVVGEFNGDLYGYVRHTQGNLTNFCVLLNRPGRTLAQSWGYDDAGLDVWFDDNAVNGDIHVYRAVAEPPPGLPIEGVWQPDGRQVDPDIANDLAPRTTTLGSFTGADANGEWILYLADMESGGTNMLAEWQIEVQGAVQPQITWSPAGHITYGTPLGGSQLNASALFNGTNVPGTFSYSPAIGMVLNAGAGQTLSVSFVPNQSDLFLGASASVLLDVLKAPLSVLADNTNRAYRASNPVFTGHLEGIQNGDGITASFTTMADATSLPGMYPITPQLADPGSRLGNYLLTVTDGTLTVTNPGPHFSALPDYLINEGSNFVLNIGAFVSSVPTDVLTFSLGAGSPSGAALGSGTGLLTWEPLPNIASTTNSITVTVTNNLVPPLGDATTFRVIVVAKPRLLDIRETSEGLFDLKWRVHLGASYRLQYKDSLLDSEWTAAAADFAADATIISTVNDAGTNLHRAYRLLQIGTPNP